MASIDILAFINVDELTTQQRAALKKRLQARQTTLKFATRAVNSALQKLAKAPKAAKRKVRRRKR